MGRNPKGSIAPKEPDAKHQRSVSECCTNMRLATVFTVLAGTVQRCECGVVHRVEHKTVVESPVARWNDPQLTFDEWVEDVVRRSMEDLEADNWELEAPQEEDPEAGF